MIRTAIFNRLCEDETKLTAALTAADTVREDLDEIKWFLKRHLNASCDDFENTLGRVLWGDHRFMSFKYIVGALNFLRKLNDLARDESS